MKRSTFCWSQHCDLLDRVEQNHQNLQLQHLLQGFTPPIIPLASSSSNLLGMNLPMQLPRPRPPIVPTGTTSAGASPAFNPFPGSPFSEIVTSPEDSVNTYGVTTGAIFGAGMAEYGAGQRIAGWGPDSPGWSATLPGGTGSGQGGQSHSSRNWS